jgi:predicted helicase
VTDAEVVEMLAQHLITKPVFEALFSDYSFAKHNPMSQAMQGVLDLLQEHRLEKEADTLHIPIPLVQVAETSGSAACRRSWIAWSAAGA